MDERQADEVRVAARHLRAATLGHVDESVRLVIVDRQRGTLAQDQRADRAGLGLGPRLGSGAGPVLGRVAVEVDAVRVGPRVVGEAVGVEVLDEQQLAARRRDRALQRLDDAAAGGLIAVDLADDEDLAGCLRVADAGEHDRAVLDRVADDRGGEQQRDHRRSASVVTTAS